MDSSGNFQLSLGTIQIQAIQSSYPFLLQMQSHCTLPSPEMAHFCFLDEKSSPIFGICGLKSVLTLDIAKQSAFMVLKAMGSLISWRLWLVFSFTTASELFTSPIVMQCLVGPWYISEMPSYSPLPLQIQNSNIAKPSGNASMSKPLEIFAKNMNMRAVNCASSLINWML